MKKHEVSKNINAVAAEFAAFAQSKGFDISQDAVLDGLRGQKGELDEAELENVSGGGSGLALCIFETRGYGENELYKHGAAVQTLYGYKSQCAHMGDILCNWLLCRCWKTSHCSDGYHECDKQGKAFAWHALTE